MSAEAHACAVAKGHITLANVSNPSFSFFEGTTMHRVVGVFIALVTTSLVFSQTLYETYTSNTPRLDGRCGPLFENAGMIALLCYSVAENVNRLSGRLVVFGFRNLRCGQRSELFELDGPIPLGRRATGHLYD
jgi:hypothetical protein